MHVLCKDLRILKYLRRRCTAKLSAFVDKHSTRLIKGARSEYGHIALFGQLVITIRLPESMNEEFLRPQTRW